MRGMETLLGESRDGLVMALVTVGLGALSSTRHCRQHSAFTTMGKAKKGASGGPSHIRARIEYLRKAAIYLQPASASDSEQVSKDGGQSTPVPQAKNATGTRQNDVNNVPRETATTGHLSQIYISHMRGVSLKTQLRLPIEVKRSFCKRCDTRLIPDVNCTQEMRNESRGRKKPWANVWVVRCAACGTEKRFPQTEKRSKELSERKKEKEERDKEHSAET